MICFTGLQALAAVFSATASEPIITDRPDFTESAVVVAKGAVQIETGLTWEDVASSIL